MTDDRNERSPFSLTSGDIVALACVTLGVVLVTMLLVWILF
jgi:hypothetical protein